MQVVYVGLLLFGVTWAAPQEEKHKGDTALHHFDKRRNQEPSSKKNIIREREQDLPLFEANENNQSSKFPNFSANKQTLKEDYSNKEEVRNDFLKSMFPKSTGNKGAEDGDEGVHNFKDQEELGAPPIRNNMPPIMRPVTVVEPWEKENKEKKPSKVLSKISAGILYAKAHSEDKRNHQRDPHSQNSPVKSKHTPHIRGNTYYLKQLPKVAKIPSDFEGSGYTNPPERDDNGISPFSGDGQTFESLPGKGGAIGTSLGSTDIQTGLSGPQEVVTVKPNTRGPGYNEIPEKEQNGGALRTKDGRVQEAGAAGVSLVEGSNDITGSTSFRELPGKEGDRVDAGSQNAHQGKVEFHYPHGPSKGSWKEGSRDATGSARDNEVPKPAQGGTRKSTEQSNRNQATLGEKQRSPSKGESQGLHIPSRGLDNEIKNEAGFHTSSGNEGGIVTHGRKNQYVPHGQNNPSRGMWQRKGSWHSRKHHSNRSFSPPNRDDSSDSDSDSSSESDGD